MSARVVERIEARLAQIERDPSSVGRSEDVVLFHLACAAILRSEDARAKLALMWPVLADLQGTIDKLDAVGKQEPHVVELYRFTREVRTLASQVNAVLQGDGPDKEPSE